MDPQANLKMTISTDIIVWKGQEICIVLSLDKELQATSDCWEKEN